MKIAILGDPIDQQSAGIHVFTLEMVKAMIQSNTEHELILVREKQDPELKDIKQIAITSTPLTAAFRKFITIPRLLNKIKADVVVEPAHFGPFNLKKNIKRVTIIHDLTPILFPEFHQPISAFLQKLFLPHILKKADLIVANSDSTKNDICKVYPNVCEKVKRIYPGVSEIFKNQKKAGILEKLNIKDPYFICVGTIEPRKNISLLLKAFHFFKDKQKSDIKLVLAGSKGWKSRKIYVEIENHAYKKDIIVTGFLKREELPTLYSGSIALVYPSLYEGFGFPVLEAMSCSIPVIIPKNSSLPEVGGNAAIYYEGNTENLGEQMNKIWIKTINNGIRSENLLKHASKFDWAMFADEIFKQIKST